MHELIFPTVCAISSTFISFLTIYQHLHNYKKPLLQRYCIRIIFMVPIYATASILSLYAISHAEYIDTLRDIYEAFVIYSFFNLLVNFLGGDRELTQLLQQRMKSYHLWPFHMCFGLINMSDPETFLFIRKGVLQFVIIKPFVSILIMTLRVADVYNEGVIEWWSAYLWINLLYNVSIFVAMYCLVLFYVQCKRDLEPLKPLPKYICIKAIIFFSFWQGLIISFLVAFNFISSENTNTPIYIQNYLICVESIGFAIMHTYAFSYHDYNESRISSRVALRYAIKDAFSLKDVFQDTYQTFFQTRYRPIEIGGDDDYVNDDEDVLLDNHEEESESIYFDEVDEGIEEEYVNSRVLIFGDSNFPVIETSGGDAAGALERLRKQQQQSRDYQGQSNLVRAESQ